MVQASSLFPLVKGVRLMLRSRFSAQLLLADAALLT
jgi:hypothetical protein